ncbi:flagellar filament capping protein FliD [Shewanella sp. A3A]|nr:flagellar filament capping protein FliD [Shewanella ferrihydritica]
MPSVSANGLGSGLDIGGIVSALVNAERAPKTAALNSDEAEVTSKISAFGSLKSAISQFQSSLTSLGNTSTFEALTTKLSNDDYLSATASEDAVAGSYKLEVEQLAESQKLGSAAVADVTSSIGSGSVSFTVNDASFSIDIASEDSLQDVVSKINNARGNSGVTATIVNSDEGAKLVLTSNETGEANQITVAASDDSGTALSDLFTMTELQAAQDSIIYVDGLKVTSDSNSVDDAITGVTLTLTDADLEESTTLTISHNTSRPKSAITAFVTAYNSMMTTVANLSSFDADTQKSSVLQGDATIRSIESQFRNAISSMFDTGSGSMALTNFGISTSRDGTLSIDSDKLDDALKNHADEVKQFFTVEDTGFADRLRGVSQSYSQTGGIIDSRNDSLDRKMDRITEQREQLNRKMDAFKARLTAQYNAMDLLVGQLNSQSNDIQSRIDSLPGLVRSNDN